jgi:copper chaperone NosL
MTARVHAFLPAPALRRALGALVASLLAILLAGCGTTGPRPLVAGTDACGYCRMTIADVRFGAQAIASTGKVTTFDAVECLAGYARSADSTAIASLWVADFAAPGTWVAAERAVYVVDARVRSPMGRSLLAFAPGSDAATLVARYGGTVRTWRELLADRGDAHVGHDAHAH